MQIFCMQRKKVSSFGEFIDDSFMTFEAFKVPILCTLIDTIDDTHSYFMDELCESDDALNILLTSYRNHNYSSYSPKLEISWKFIGLAAGFALQISSEECVP